MDTDLLLSDQQLLELAIFQSFQDINQNNILIPHLYQINTNTKIQNKLPLKCRDNEIYIECVKKYSTFAAVILFPDDNDKAFTIQDEDLQMRMCYLAREYHVFLKRVKNLNEAIDITKKINLNYNIGHMELGGHGNPTSLAWPKERLEVNKNRDKLTILFGMLHYDAAIFTLSCNNGQEIYGDNLLDYFAKIARGHRVIGISCANSNRLLLKISGAKPFQIEYTDQHGRDVTVTKLY